MIGKLVGLYVSTIIIIPLLYMYVLFDGLQALIL